MKPTRKTLSKSIGTIIIGSAAFVLGMTVGGAVATGLELPAPVLPPEIDANATARLLLVTSPLFVLTLWLLNRHLAGGRVARSAMLFLFAWIAYSINNVIEAAIFTSYEGAGLFSVVTFLPAIVLSALSVAWLSPGAGTPPTVRTVWRRHFRQRRAQDWVWRLALAAVAFAPIYYFFGWLIVPLVGKTYTSGAFGLAAPPLQTLLPVLLGRSLLFFAASLPLVVAWQGGRRDLWLSLGLSLFVLVGLIYMLAGSWLPVAMRLVHSAEILADSIVYAGVLVWLLKPKKSSDASDLRYDTGETAFGKTIDHERKEFA